MDLSFQTAGTEFFYNIMQYTSNKTGQTYFLNRIPTQREGSFLYYFSKKKNEERSCEEVPNGYHIVESDNGFPIMKKIKETAAVPA
jgi:hypothetical protein